MHKEIVKGNIITLKSMNPGVGCTPAISHRPIHYKAIDPVIPDVIEKLAIEGTIY